jgi:predicted amidophosphoribosyltransferase
MTPPNFNIVENRMSRKNETQNRQAVIVTREDRTGKLRTETSRRDQNTTSFALSTNPKANSTSLFIDTVDGGIAMNGAEARTLYRLLRKHYKFTGKSR